jgi:hypothetical protein
LELIVTARLTKQTICDRGKKPDPLRKRCTI